MKPGTISLLPYAPTHFDTVLKWFDAPDFYFATSCPESMRYSWIRELTRASRPTLLVADADGEPAGLCGFERDRWDPSTLNLHFRMADRDAWRAYGAQCLAAFVQFLFDSQNPVRLTIPCLSFDEIGLRFFEASSFTADATHREAAFKRGAYRDAVQFSLLSGDCVRPFVADVLFPTGGARTFDGFDFPAPTSFIRSEKLALRRIVPSDAPLVAAWMSGRAYNDYIYEFGTLSSVEGNIEHVVSTIEKTDPAKLEFVIELPSGKPIGLAWLADITFEDRHAELFMFIGDEAYLGLGHGFVAEVMLRNFAFFELNLHMVFAGIKDSNEQMMRSIKARKETIAARFLRKDFGAGAYHDTVLVATMNPLHQRAAPAETFAPFPVVVPEESLNPGGS